MEKKIVSLMCENIRKQSVDVDEMAKEDPKKAIAYIHEQYLIAKNQFRCGLRK